MDIFNFIIDTKQASVLSGYSQRHIERLCSSGSVKAKKVGFSWIIDRRLFNLKRPGHIDKDHTGEIRQQVILRFMNGAATLEEALNYEGYNSLSDAEKHDVISKLRFSGGSL
jgi:hypothetical protein